MTKIKLCGMMRPQDIEAVNELRPDYCGFILSQGFRRSLTEERFYPLYRNLDRSIRAVGVFVNEELKDVLRYANSLDLIQLHGSEDEDYIARLRSWTDKPVIKAFRIASAADAAAAAESSADHILLDSGTGSGRVFDHSLIKNIERPFFLAGGLDAVNAAAVIERLHPYAVDVSSSIETDGFKDKRKMAAFVRAVRGKDN